MRKDKKLLLAQKKHGFGAGFYNGVGGKLEPSETPEQAMLRETKEEISIIPTVYRKVGVIDYDEFVKGNRENVRLHLYLATDWNGEPAESDEMCPKWFPESNPPYDQMFPDDRYWLPLVLAGKHIKAFFHFDPDWNLISHSIKEISVRGLKIEDTEAIRKFHRKSWRDTYPNEEAGVSRKWVDQTTDEWLTPENLKRSREIYQSVLDNPENEYYRLVEVDGEIQGFMHGARRGEDRLQHLSAIYIDKSLQGTGIAQQLIDELFGFLDLNKDIWLEVANYNERAKAFYRRNGFEVVEGSEFLFKDMLPCVKMVRKGEK